MNYPVKFVMIFLKIYSWIDKKNNFKDKCNKTHYWISNRARNKSTRIINII